MVKCPFCQFDNEDGVLFCEQCKSDLGGLGDQTSQAMPMAEPIGAGIAEALTEPMPATPIEAVPEAEATAPMAFAEPVATAPPPEESTVGLQMPPITDPMTAPPQVLDAECTGRRTGRRRQAAPCRHSRRQDRRRVPAL